MHTGHRALNCVDVALYRLKEKADSFRVFAVGPISVVVTHVS